jgi:amino-acid N-acetyltransferase
MGAVHPLPQAELRIAKLQDIPEILALIEANRDHLLPRTEAELRESIQNSWVIDLEGEILGCVILDVYSPKIAEIRSLAVRKDQRGRGFGKLLVEAAVAEGHSRGIREIMAITSTPQFFESLSFGFSPNEKYAVFWNGAKKS